MHAVALALIAVGSVGCVGTCPDGTPDDLFVRVSSTLETPETEGDPREVGSYGRPRENGARIGYLFQHPDLATDPTARNEWIGHLVLEWPDDLSREIALDAHNCRFVIDPDGTRDRVIDGPIVGTLLLPGYSCTGTASRTLGNDVTIVFDAELVDGADLTGHVVGEYVKDYREPSCGGVLDDD
jgi:hypothetical protein